MAADTACGSAEMLDWRVHDQGIEPHIPVIDKYERIDGTFSRSDFTYDHAQNLRKLAKLIPPLTPAAAFLNETSQRQPRYAENRF